MTVTADGEKVTLDIGECSDFAKKSQHFFSACWDLTKAKYPRMRVLLLTDGDETVTQIGGEEMK